LNINNFHTTKSQQRKNNLLTLAISPAAVVHAPRSQSKEKNTEKQIEVTYISVHSLRLHSPDVKLMNRNYVLLIMKDHERTLEPTQQKTL
jgi:hypothetical protein